MQKSIRQLAPLAVILAAITLFSGRAYPLAFAAVWAAFVLIAVPLNLAANRKNATR